MGNITQDELLSPDTRPPHEQIGAPYITQERFIRLTVLIFYLILIFIGLTVRVIYLSVGSANQEAVFRQMMASPDALVRLRAQDIILQDTIQNINNLSVSDLQKRISNISDILAIAQDQLKTKENGLEKLQTLVASGTDQYDSLKRDIVKLNALKEDQLRLAASIVAQESNQDYWWKNLAGLTISFLTGVLSSLIANHLWERYFQKTHGARK